MSKDFSRMAGPPPLKNVWSAYQLMKEIQQDLLGYLDRSFKQYGDVFKIEGFGNCQIFVKHPQHIKEILTEQSLIKGNGYTNKQKGLAKFIGQGIFTSNQELWRRQRKLLAPAFLPKQLQLYFPVIQQTIAESVRSLQLKKEVDLDEVMMNLTLDIVARTLFSTDIRPQARQISHCMDALHGMVKANSSIWTILPGWFPTPQRMKENKALKTLDAIVYDLIQQRRSSEQDQRVKQDFGDISSVLLNACDEQGQLMSTQQVRDEIVTLFLAGHETSANALCWTFILLAQNPAAREEVQREIQALGVDSHSPFELAHLNQMVFTEAVIKEAIRLYPPVHLFQRSTTQDFLFNGFNIPAGIEFSIVPYFTHRDQRFFNDPNSFVPQRFFKNNNAKINQYAWIPFGVGPRVCLGQGFAMMEMMLVLAHFCRAYRFELPGDEHIPPQPGITLRPHPPVRFKIHRYA